MKEGCLSITYSVDFTEIMVLKIRNNEHDVQIFRII